MRPSVRRVTTTLLAATALLGCGRERSRTRHDDPVATPPTRTPPTTTSAVPPSASLGALGAGVGTPAPSALPPGGLAAAVGQLADPRQDVRDAAAAQVRAALAAGASLPGDRGVAHWQALLATVAPGTTTDAFRRRTGATGEGGASSGQSATLTWRLDDVWTVTTYVDLPDRIREITAPTRHVRASWVAPPADHSGRWVTYFVTGTIAHDIDYDHGSYRRFAAYHDSGHLASEQRYKDDGIDGPEVGFHPDGAKAYEIGYADGKPAGHWQHWYPDGTRQSEVTYVDGVRHGRSTEWRPDGTRAVLFEHDHGRELGQTAWDEHGALLYARGSLAPLPPRTRTK